ncbi:hypothetical protein [Haloarcula montana]|uniref:hypothetical protein n=1 Tax=Haloarcula montana TaxID=3111776 RepID=UPI002D776616|nr:hypothetical protein [Haloarcula sp. GH36]
MARTRALLTKTDREQISKEGEVDENKRYQAISRVRNRIQDELPQDVELLEEHHPELLDEIRAIVCDEEDI